jgi:hypothetical protein
MLYKTCVVQRWMTSKKAARYAKIDYPEFSELLATGAIPSACLRRDPRSKREIRLVDKGELDRFLWHNGYREVPR